jgi:hypothetical protein
MLMKTPVMSVPIPTTLAYPPRTIQAERGEVVGVVLSKRDYHLFLRVLASHADWEALPLYLQDDIDNMLTDKALAEEGERHSLRDLLAQEQE